MRDIFEYHDNFADFADVKSHLLWGDEKAVQSPEVSILVPCYSHPKYLKAALDSAVNQDFSGKYEIIVCDNNELNDEPTGNQRVVEELNDPRILYYRNEKNLGMFGNWNRLIELSRAPFIVYLHDDDVLLPNALTTLMGVRSKYDADAVFGGGYTIDGEGNITSDTKPQKRNKYGVRLREIVKCSAMDLFLGNITCGCGSIFRKTALVEIGGYTPEFFPAADYAMYAVMSAKYKTYICRIPTFCYRVAENESCTAYKDFPKIGRHVMTCMRKYVHLPNVVLNRMITAACRLGAIHCEVVWGGADESLLKQKRLDDRIIMRLTNTVASWLLNHRSL